MSNNIKPKVTPKSTIAFKPAVQTGSVGEVPGATDQVTYLQAQINALQSTMDWQQTVLLGLSKTLQLPTDSTMKDLPAWAEQQVNELTALRAQTKGNAQ